MIRLIHRYLSLAVLALWLVQAVTGTLIVFRWELDDAAVAGENVPVDWTRLGATVDALARQPGAEVSSVWTSGTAHNRFDAHLSVNGHDRSIRLDGVGRALRDRSDEAKVADGTVWDTLTLVHMQLLSGDTGEWIIGLSGVLLLTNIALGLKLAWPKRGTWAKTMLGKPKGGRHAKLYGWHRKVGLWFAPVALVTIGAGVMMAFGDGLETRLGAELPEPAMPPASAGPPIGFARAVTTALGAVPESRFAGISLPNADTRWYEVRVTSPGEVPRKWGASVVHVAAADGRVLATHDAAQGSAGRKLIDNLYPVHTGQVASWIGRIVVLLIGSALIAMIVLGLLQWQARRASSRR